MKRLDLITAVFLASCVSCTTQLPDISPERFACTDDDPDPDGLLPCPETHWCSKERCVERLGCREAGSSNPGCKPDVTRCELATESGIAAVECRPGLHTETSTPARRSDCRCPDGTSCVVWAETGATTGDAYPLYVRPRLAPNEPNSPAVDLPVGQLGIQGENAERRTCARACSHELDCPANHTCRAAVVLQPALLASPTSTRHTVGVCWPDRVTLSSTTAPPSSQPDPLHCESNGDCGGSTGRPEGACRAEVVVVRDHPVIGAGPAWSSTRRAIVARCTGAGGGLTPDNSGCTAGEECRSGVCREGRCAQLCESGVTDCFGGGFCEDLETTRKVPDGSEIPDRLYLCPSF